MATGEPRAGGLRYRPEVDGLRAIAVLGVILFHARFRMFHGGFAGVDVFFVISGYLITSLILSDLDRGRFSILNFYERRARRILPALFLVMAACLPFAWLWLMPSDLQDFAQSLTAVSTFTSNVLFWQESGYFDIHAELKPLLHTWSLAVEEQYYILFPPLLMLLKPLGHRGTLKVFGVLGVASLAAAQWGTLYAPDAAFYLLPTRGWELLLGAATAIYLRDREDRGEAPPVSQRLSLAGFLLILGSIFWCSQKTPFPGLWALIPTVGTALVILYARADTTVHRLLTRRPVVAIGLISYSAYLWHQPLFAFTRNRAWDEPPKWALIGLALAALALAYLSWRYVEQPFRDRARTSRRLIAGSAVAAAATFIALGLIGDAAAGFPARPLGLIAESYPLDNKALQDESWKPLNDLAKAHGMEEVPYEAMAWFDPSDPRERLLVLGNSHGKDFYNVLHFSAAAQRAFQVARYSAQIEDLANPADPLYGAPNYVAAQRIVIATHYSPKDIAALPDVIKHLRRDGKAVVLTRNIFEYREFGPRTLSDHLLHELMMAGKLPADPAAAATLVNRAFYDDYRAGRTKNPESLAANAAIDRIAQELKVPVADRMDYMCSRDAGVCYGIGDAYQKHFYDYGHNTLDGARFFAARVDQTHWIDELRQP